VNPHAQLFLVDALSEYIPHIERWLALRRGEYEIAALGAASGEIVLHVESDHPTRTSALPRTPLTRNGGRIEPRRVRLATLDGLVESRGLSGPFGLKIDTEGFELEVLRGAAATLRDTRFVIAEISVQRRFEGSYTFAELVKHMDAGGFDVDSILTANRDAGGIIRYVDLLFVRRSG
jgi:FkbM family methyltransferase